LFRLNNNYTRAGEPCPVRYQGDQELAAYLL
jgi:hypothetical protein